MTELFLTVLHMSLTASYVILFVILIRMLLKKAPKVLSYALWAVVAFRLVVPFSFESIFSLMPRNASTVPILRDMIYQQNPVSNTGIKAVDSFGNKSLPAPAVGASANPLQVYVETGAYIWAFGILALLVYSLAAVCILKKKLKNAHFAEENIFEAGNLKTPFVLGLIKPRIYLPAGLHTEEKNYILLHEQTHIRRRDPVVKALAFLILSVHWLNPLVWIAFRLMNTDMELSCDERVLKKMNTDRKKSYAGSLLSLAAGKHILSGGTLAFGEGNVRGRIKNVLNYKRPKAWVIVFSILIMAAAGIGLMTNPKSATGAPAVPELSPQQTVGADMAELDYASDHILIFHGYFGLFVYDLDALQMIRSLDLKPLNCDQTQGDNYCNVSVSRNGNTVQLHPVSSGNMFIYAVSDHILREKAYQQMKDPYGSEFVPMEKLNTTRPGNYSYHAVRFDTGEYGYLYTEDETIGTLSYIRGDKVYKLFDFGS